MLHHGRRQLREIEGAKLKSGGQSFFIIPELDWGEVLVKIRWSQKKKKKGLRRNLKAFSGRNHKI